MWFYHGLVFNGVIGFPYSGARAFHHLSFSFSCSEFENREIYWTKTCDSGVHSPLVHTDTVMVIAPGVVTPALWIAFFSGIFSNSYT